jgi:Divergent InlB B-repeat domain
MDGNVFTALDNSKVGTDKSNIEWLESAAEDLCGKAIHAAPKDAKTGKVSGIIYGGNTAPNPGIAKLNDAIACSDTSYDCDEMIHDDESVTLTATAKTNYAFDKWTDGAGNQSALCPCSLLDPANPTCNFSYESVGFYPPVGDPDNLQNMGSSSEVAYCQANFKFSRPYPTGYPMSPTP